MDDAMDGGSSAAAAATASAQAPAVSGPHAAAPAAAAGQGLPGSRLEAIAQMPRFLRGCQWSPDGLCVLTATDANDLVLFNTPAPLAAGGVMAHRDDDGHSAADADGAHAAAAGPVGAATALAPALSVQEGEQIYDYCWYPRMNSYNPASCVFVSSTRDHPLHLWDAFTGALRCTYRAYDHLDEITAAHSVAFAPDGSRVYAGYKDCVRVFDVARPGRDCATRPTAGASGDGQRGIVSCMAFAVGAPSVYACGSFSRSVGVYDDATGEPWAVLEVAGGVTQVALSHDGSRLYTGCRQHPDILCWDLRNTVRVLGTFARNAATNQRIQFDLTADGATLATGGRDGVVALYDARGTDGAAEPTATLAAHADSANGVSLHPLRPALLATASGQRRFASPDLSSDEDSDTDAGSSSESASAPSSGSDDGDGRGSGGENTLKMWSLGKGAFAARDA